MVGLMTVDRRSIVADWRLLLLAAAVGARKPAGPRLATALHTQLKAVQIRPEEQHAGKCAGSKRTAAVDHAGIDGKQRWETCRRREKEAEKGPGILQTEDVGASASIQVVSGGV